MQVTLLAPNVLDLGDAGHPSYRSVAGVGILIQLNGEADTGTFAQPLTVDLSGREIRPGDQAAVWDGSTFRFIGGSVTAGTEEFSYHRGIEQDFAVLAPVRGGSGHRPGQAQGTGATTRFSRGGYLSDVVLESVFFAPAGAFPAGFGVRSAGWLAARSH